ncbi:hypothetical protein N9Y65_01795 [Alphaproteobacteria bacterium]|nr:hypothetical protein [Alphaproteobacteria bacterium]
MAKKEEPIADSETGKIKVKKKEAKQPDGNETKGNVTKVAAKMKKPAEVVEPTVTKVDLNNPLEEKPVEEVEPEAEVQEVEKQETPALEDITDEVAEQPGEIVAEAIEESIETGEPLPENIQKLMEFMNETGGDLNDYVKLNQDYSEMDNQDLLHEYYKQTKPHLNNEEINFLMEDTFSFDEDVDDDREIRRKKLALKEQVASAKSHLDGQKSKYYDEIKAGSKLTGEQQKAIDFFNRYNKESEATQKTVKTNSDIFTQKTNNVFNDKFKGFEYNVGDKKYRFNVNNAEEVRDTQSDIGNFTKKFLDENSALKDAKGYHKSLYTAMNADAVAKHFYEQGKADAMKSSIAKAKNVDMSPRQAHGKIEAGGMTVKVLSDSSSDFKFKIKNNKFKK